LSKCPSTFRGLLGDDSISGGTKAGGNKSWRPHRATPIIESNTPGVATPARAVLIPDSQFRSEGKESDSLVFFRNQALLAEAGKDRDELAGKLGQVVEQNKKFTEKTSHSLELIKSLKLQVGEFTDQRASSERKLAEVTSEIALLRDAKVTHENELGVGNSLLLFLSRIPFSDQATKQPTQISFNRP